MRRLSLILALVGCAKGAPLEEGSGDVDASITHQPDAPSQLVDAAVASPDAPPVDAPSAGCTTMTSNLLANGSFESVAANWVEARIDPSYPLVTNSSGPTGAQSGTYRAWLAGVETTTANNKDSLYQQVAVPA